MNDDCYDVDGNAITFWEWVALWEQRAATAYLQESWWHKRTVVGFKEVSTVWMGIDYRFGGNGPPLIWETMIFNRDALGDDEQYRYATRGEAYDHHELLVRELRAEVRAR